MVSVFLRAPPYDANANKKAVVHRRLGSYGGEDSPNDITRGMHAGEVGVPRLLKLFQKHGLTTTWFIPGHSLETFPKEMAAVRDAGHEIGLHGYSHENVNLKAYKIGKGDASTKHTLP